MIESRRQVGASLHQTQVAAEESPRQAMLVPLERRIIMLQDLQDDRTSWRRAAAMATIMAAALALLTPLQAAEVDLTSVNILVTDAETGQPIYQAHLTLQFEEQGRKVHVTPKILSFNAKTNAQGRYRFVDIPKGTIRLLVTADRHQTANKEFQVDRDNPLFEVKLRKPQDQI
jgi:carboxypeptidase family protein